MIVRNPFSHQAVATVELAVPSGWAAPESQRLTLEPGGEGMLRFELRAGKPQRRALVAADLTVDDARFGRQAVAVVGVT